MSDEKQTAIKALMLMGTLLSYIKIHEQTKAINKIKRDVRKGLRSIHRSDEALFGRLSKEADRVWEKAKRAANDKEYTVSLIAMLSALWALLDGNRYQTLFFTERTFQRCISSMTGIATHQDDATIEHDSFFLTDIFAEGLGITTDTGLKSVVNVEKTKRSLAEKDNILDGSSGWRL